MQEPYAGALLGFLIWIFTRSTLRIEVLLENSRPVLLVHSMHEASSQFERITSHYPPVGEMYLLKKTVVLLTTHNLIQFEVSQLASSKGKPVEVAHLTHSSSSRNPSWATPRLQSERWWTRSRFISSLAPIGLCPKDAAQNVVMMIHHGIWGGPKWTDSKSIENAS